MSITLISQESRLLYNVILQYSTWIENICDDYEESHSVSTMKPHYVAEFREAIRGACEEGENALVVNDFSQLLEIGMFLFSLHDDAINRVQPRVLCTQEQFEGYVLEHTHEIEKYGFYRNGSGRIEER